MATTTSKGQHGQGLETTEGAEGQQINENANPG